MRVLTQFSFDATVSSSDDGVLTGFDFRAALQTSAADWILFPVRTVASDIHFASVSWLAVLQLHSSCFAHLTIVLVKCMTGHREKTVGGPAESFSVDSSLYR